MSDETEAHDPQSSYLCAAHACAHYLPAGLCPGCGAPLDDNHAGSTRFGCQCPGIVSSGEPLYGVIEDAIWQALDSEQGMPHSGVDPSYVVPEFLRLLDEAGYTVTAKPPTPPPTDPGAGWDDISPPMVDMP